jgi:hypothetical protein
MYCHCNNNNNNFTVFVTFRGFINIQMQQKFHTMSKTIPGSAREVKYNVYKRCLAEYQAGIILSEYENVNECL